MEAVSLNSSMGNKFSANAAGAAIYRVFFYVRILRKGREIDVS